MNNEVEKYVEFLLKEGSETTNVQKRTMFIQTAKLLLELNIKANQLNTINYGPWTWQPNTNQDSAILPNTLLPSITCVNDKNNVQLSATANVTT